VWLKESFTPGGKRLGVIDCRHESNPCAWHSALAQFPQRNSASLKQKQLNVEKMGQAEESLPCRATSGIRVTVAVSLEVAAVEISHGYQERISFGTA
jgi:hypothetical protein